MQCEFSSFNSFNASLDMTGIKLFVFNSAVFQRKIKVTFILIAVCALSLSHTHTRFSK